MIKFTQPAVAGGLAACVIAAAAMAAGTAPGSASHPEARASGTTAFADSSTAGPAAISFFSQVAQPSQATVDQSCLQYPATCYTPKSFLTAYGIQALHNHGIDGRGETIVVPEVAEQPESQFTDIRQDLATFDGLYGFPAPKLNVITTLGGASAPYLAGFEEIEDVEILHAVAPEATIDVVLVPDSAGDSPASIVTALTDFMQLAVSRANVLSISASVGEHYLTTAESAQLNTALQSAADHHVTVVASSGDTGATSDQDFPTAPVKEVSMPASDPLVLAAGGTSLAVNPATGAYSAEIAWSTSGGGFSHLFTRPAYQDGVSGMTATRGVPDVASDADSNTGMAVAVASSATEYSLYSTGGTSAATPLWAGVIALADQYAGRSLGFVNPAIYRIGHSPQGRTAFHDVTAGDNSIVVVPSLITGYRAAPGWDPVTGWGSPDAQVLVPLLARDIQP